MTKLEFVEKLYNGRNCYSDHMGSDELSLLHICSNAESLIADFLARNKVVFLTGNPGDGKTFIIKALAENIAIHPVKRHVQSFFTKKATTCLTRSRPCCTMELQSGNVPL